jgi:hypothetical protein
MNARQVRTGVRFTALTTVMLAAYLLAHLIVALPFLVAGL